MTSFACLAGGQASPFFDYTYNLTFALILFSFTLENNYPLLISQIDGNVIFYYGIHFYSEKREDFPGLLKSIIMALFASSKKFEILLTTIPIIDLPSRFSVFLNVISVWSFGTFMAFPLIVHL